MADETKLPDGEDASVSAIMRHMPGLSREAALQNFRAIDEGQRAFNAAKKADAKMVTISRATLFRLLMGAAATLGMDVLDPKRGGPDA